MAFCRYHPYRPGIGVCIRCRVVICTACCTRVDGVNHCHACLKVLAQRREPVSRGDVGTVVGALAVLGAAWLAFLGVALLIQGRFAP